MPPLSENDIAYLKAEELEAGLRRAESRLPQFLTWHRPAGYQRHLAEDGMGIPPTTETAKAA